MGKVCPLDQKQGLCEHEQLMLIIVAAIIGLIVLLQAVIGIWGSRFNVF